MLFHTITAIGVVAVATSNDDIDKSLNLKKKLFIGINIFLLGVISHGVLDYIPHCYPISAKIDVMISSFLIGVLTLFAQAHHRFFMVLAFIACIFPDLIDLSPAILNNNFGFDLPIFEKVFPWHYSEYSGSIYTTNCGVSTINHCLVLLTILLICYARRNALKYIYYA